MHFHAPIPILRSVDDLEAYHGEMTAKDGFGNKLTFFGPKS
jgi:hypothetical protein